jgi:hypothetical protein
LQEQNLLDLETPVKAAVLVTVLGKALDEATLEMLMIELADDDLSPYASQKSS